MKITPLHLIPTSHQQAALAYVQSRLACGFPSPAGDYIEGMPSLDELLIKHPAATFVARAEGESMIERGILDGSLLIIDRSLAPTHNATIVASIAGELTVKILDLNFRLLRPANAAHKSIPLPDTLDVVCEGVVTYCITPQGNIRFN